MNHSPQIVSMRLYSNGWYLYRFMPHVWGVFATYLHVQVALSVVLATRTPSTAQKSSMASHNSPTHSNISNLHVHTGPFTHSYIHICQLLSFNPGSLWLCLEQCLLVSPMVIVSQSKVLPAPILHKYSLLSGAEWPLYPLQLLHLWVLNYPIFPQLQLPLPVFPVPLTQALKDVSPVSLTFSVSWGSVPCNSKLIVSWDCVLCCLTLTVLWGDVSCGVSLIQAWAWQSILHFTLHCDSQPLRISHFCTHIHQRPHCHLAVNLPDKHCKAVWIHAPQCPIASAKLVGYNSFKTWI